MIELSFYPSEVDKVNISARIMMKVTFSLEVDPLNPSYGAIQL